MVDLDDWKKIVNTTGFPKTRAEVIEDLEKRVDELKKENESLKHELKLLKTSANKNELKEGKTFPFIASECCERAGQKRKALEEEYRVDNKDHKKFRTDLSREDNQNVLEFYVKQTLLCEINKGRDRVLIDFEKHKSGDLAKWTEAVRINEHVYVHSAQLGFAVDIIFDKEWIEKTFSKLLEKNGFYWKILPHRTRTSYEYTLAVVCHEVVLPNPVKDPSSESDGELYPGFETD